MSPTENDAQELTRLRAEIDRLNLRLLTTLQMRGRVVEAIMAIKQRTGVEAHDPRREALMLERLVRHSTGPYSSADIERIFRAIFEASRTLVMAVPVEAANE